MSYPTTICARSGLETRSELVWLWPKNGDFIGELTNGIICRYHADHKTVWITNWPSPVSWTERRMFPLKTFWEKTLYAASESIWMIMGDLQRTLPRNGFSFWCLPSDLAYLLILSTLTELEHNVLSEHCLLCGQHCGNRFCGVPIKRKVRGDLQW